MDATQKLVESIDNLLSAAPSTGWKDDFQALDVIIRAVDEARPVLEKLLADVGQGILKYETAVIQIASANDAQSKVPHPIRRNASDAILGQETLDKGLLCHQHSEQYERLLEEQQNEYEIPEWQRYSLLQAIGSCDDCSVNAYVEIVLDKNDLESRFRRAFRSDLPHISGKIDDLRISFWADLKSLYSIIEHEPLRAYRSIAEWRRPCLLACLNNAENDGADYFRSIPTKMCVQREVIESALARLLTTQSLQSVTSSRETQIHEYPNDLGYLPPEYWVNSTLIALAHAGEPLPNWFMTVAILFTLSTLATVSSNVIVDSAGRLRFEIKREIELKLRCAFTNNMVAILQDDGTEISVLLDTKVAHAILNFYGVALHGKYTTINLDLIQRAIVYGASFSFNAFFSKMEQISRFYEFEYTHLLGDRFEQQSRTLQTFITNMVDLRQRLAALIDSLSRDLSALAIAVLATSALAIVAKVLDIKTWDNIVAYGMLTTPILAYLYITVFFLRIDDLKESGERAVDELTQDMALSQQIWDFPLHTIGVPEERLERNAILGPLLRQHRINQLAAVVVGLISHTLFLVLAQSAGLWWISAPKLIVDSVFFGRAYWVRTKGQSRVGYYFLVWLVTLIFAVVFARQV